MTLYDSIMDYERRELTTSFIAASQMDLSLQMGLKLSPGGVDFAIKQDLEKSGVMLEAAYALREDKLSEEGLERVVEEIERVEGPLAQLYHNEKYIPLRKDYVKARVELYQQLIQQEGKADTFEEAVRKQFADRDGYKKAIEPIIKAEEKMYAALKELYPIMTGTMAAAEEAGKKVREASYSYLFPKI